MPDAALVLDLTPHATKPCASIFHKHQTLVSNAFVFCQIFNQFNALVLDHSFNFFQGILMNYYFKAIFMIMRGGQTSIVEVGGAAFQVTSTGWRDWLSSMIIGVVLLPLKAMIKLVSTVPIGRLLLYRWGWLRDPSKLEVKVVNLGKQHQDAGRPEPENELNKWNPAIERVRDDLFPLSQMAPSEGPKQ
ncbi:hypothetical protein PCANC_13254 [Puccinia coronata f. sp. avenae]|uniref:Cation-transporting P-type ATPase C-terminal domain-containing protein n=1 Tax=Puccinia coronata f. sp. avenae TaxID=200324 RepID=A0A2N5V0L9_9BASI|nr:hypothetical protein PCASD_19840 [Puccinia coronata f. sp. avenae]PLW43543.1 hypothetical protein PCANC_13254 [Puccinia coronata f. sp. avenae]